MGERWTTTTIPLLRLLDPDRRLVALDPGRVLSIGRDKAHEPRIRLRDLLVSKTHATLFWFAPDDHGRDPDARGYWAVADCGSMHGTFLARADQEERLSPSRVASSPFRLHHRDVLRVGSRSFSIHLHPSLPCADCSIALDSSNLLPLVVSTATPDKLEPTAVKTKAEKGLMLREALHDLKAKYRAPSPPSTRNVPSASAPQYHDRAKERRNRSHAKVPAPVPPLPALVAPHPTPFDVDSRGSKLLTKLTNFDPALDANPHDSSVGPRPAFDSIIATSRGLGKLIEARSISTHRGESRPGLGSAPLVAAGASQENDKRNWRQDVREQSRKRFKDMI